jgi:hypothetical protein
MLSINGCFYGSGLDISGATEQMYAPVSTGIYAVRITKDGCTVTSSCNPITGINNELVEDMLLTYYPNPVTSDLFIKLKENFNHVDVRIDDLTGRLMQTAKFVHQHSLYLDVRDLKSGVYFVTVSADGKTTSFKVIKTSEL